MKSIQNKKTCKIVGSVWWIILSISYMYSLVILLIRESWHNLDFSFLEQPWLKIKNFSTVIAMASMTIGHNNWPLRPVGLNWSWASWYWNNPAGKIQVSVYHCLRQLGPIQMACNKQKFKFCGANFVQLLALMMQNEGRGLGYLIFVEKCWFQLFICMHFAVQMKLRWLVWMCNSTPSSIIQNSVNTMKMERSSSSPTMSLSCFELLVLWNLFLHHQWNKPSFDNCK